MTTPHLTVVGPYVRHTSRTTLEQKLAWLGGFAVVALLVVEWRDSRAR